MNKILKYGGIPFGFVVGWAGYLFAYKWKYLGKNIETWEGLVLLGLIAIVVLIVEAIQPSFR